MDDLPDVEFTGVVPPPGSPARPKANKARKLPAFYLHFGRRGKKSSTRLKVCIEGNPLALQRPRLRKCAGMRDFRVRAFYNPSKADQVLFREAFRLAVHHSEAIHGEQPLRCIDADSAVHADSVSVFAVTLHFLFPRPHSHFHRGTDDLKADAPRHVGNVPDIDNLVKFVLDAINGLVFKDDKQVVELHSEKRYTDSAVGCVFLTLEKLNNLASSQTATIVD
jgi:hypothetical protein